MSGIYFYIDFKAMALLLLCSVPFWFLWQQRKTYVEPHLVFPDVSGLSWNKGRVVWALWPARLKWITFICFVTAFLDPHLLVERKPGAHNANGIPPTQGVAIYLLLDQSGSMKEHVSAPSAYGQRLLSKIDLVKEVSRKFIEGDPQLGLEGRPNDEIGLVFFARAARVMAPLTLDHTAVLQELAKFDAIGDRDQDGTSLGYAIFKTANLMAANRYFSQELIAKGEPAYTIKSNVIILLTDGLQDPNPLDKGKRLRNMDVPEAAEQAKALGVRLYMVNVDPSMDTEEFAPYRHIMQRAAELTGGKFYMVDQSTDLEKIYHDIDTLEKSAIPAPQNAYERDKRPDLYRRISFYPYLLGLGMLCLFLSIMLDTTILRRIP